MTLKPRNLGKRAVSFKHHNRQIRNRVLNLSTMVEVLDTMSGDSSPQEDQLSRARQQIANLFTSRPPIRDTLETPSSWLQDETVDDCLPFLTGLEHEKLNSHGIPRLDRDRHVKFLHKHLGELPGVYMAADPSRPWLFYWCLSALVILGEDVAFYRAKLVDTVRPMQNATGGFAGGFGQTSHLANSYATILALILVGGTEAYELVDRRSMWKWLCSLKQPDGGFQMAVGGEEDVRFVFGNIVSEDLSLS